MDKNNETMSLFIIIFGIFWISALIVKILSIFDRRASADFEKIQHRRWRDQAWERRNWKYTLPDRVRRSRSYPLFEKLTFDYHASKSFKAM